ncbi:discoidin domain-containing protein [Bacillus sp. Cr_A10]|uniref:discoidin domain-containing protein n=1 Tax=Bacillus sp. Cr_A10 TaxID=3033993 RepID=UPI0023DB1FF0|nr:discoidin domain-containing protein [Bacillus sp. Cr_A10]MDF2066538.1 hypothetical protein [Bacillus sp. Cr_A10]
MKKIGILLMLFLLVLPINIFARDLTSSTAGTITASGGIDYQKAFDDNTSTYTNAWRFGASAEFIPQWITYEFNESKLINSVNLWSHYNKGYEAVKDFKIIASNTGEFSGEEVILFTGTHPNETTNNFINYTFDNENKFKFYRLKVESIYLGNGSNNLNIMEIELSNSSYYDKTSVSGIISASSGEHPQYAFDDKTNHYGVAWTKTGSQAMLPEWIQYEFLTNEVINEVQIWSHYNSGYEAIKDFDIQASNTGDFTGEEVTIYTGLHPNETTNGFITYSFNNENAYKYYRLVVKSLYPGNGGDNLNIMEIDMFEVKKEINVYGLPLDMTNNYSVVAASGGLDPNKAFDNLTADYTDAWRFGNMSSFESQWIQYEFSESEVINYLKLWSNYNNGYEAVRDFTIKGSNTGSFTGEENILYSGVHLNDTTDNFIDYSFENTNPYKYYRLEIYSIYPGNGNNNLNIKEVELSNTRYFDRAIEGITTSSNGLYSEKAFDNRVGSYGNAWRLPESTDTLPISWVQYEFNTEEVINYIRIWSAYTSGFEAVKDFEVQASNTGLFAGEEEILYTGVHPNSHAMFIDYPFANYNAYKFYRFKVNSAHLGDGGNNINIMEIDLLNYK